MEWKLFFYLGLACWNVYLFLKIQGLEGEAKKLKQNVNHLAAEKVKTDLRRFRI